MVLILIFIKGTFFMQQVRFLMQHFSMHLSQRMTFIVCFVNR